MTLTTWATAAVRAVGELVQNQVRVGLLRMERMVKEKMTLVEQENASPQALVQHPPRGGSGARVLRRLSALAVHGPD